MVEIQILNESFLKIICDRDIFINISDYFSFFAENYIWNPKYKAGLWDGKIKMLSKNGALPVGHLKRLVDFCNSSNLSYNITGSVPKGITITNKNIDDFSTKFIKNGLKLRDYQYKMIYLAFKENKCVGVLPTGSGKSYVQFLIAKLFLKINNSKSKVLLVVPTVALVHQMFNDFKEYGEHISYDFVNDLHCIYSGQEKESNKPIVISTWQSLQDLPGKYFKNFGCILADEVHTTAGVKLQNIMKHCTNAQIKVGVSGSLYDRQVNMSQLEGLFGKVHNLTSTKELIDRGLLSKLKINCLVLQYPENERKIVKGMTYFEEMDYIKLHPKRLSFIVNLTKSIDNNIMLLFKNIDYGNELYEKLKKTCKNRKVYFIIGKTDSEVRERARTLTNKSKNNIIVASIQIFSTGINIPNLNSIIFCQPIKSKIKVVQSIGRALRKTAIKDSAEIFDITDNFTFKRTKNYSFKHSLERIEIYKKEKHKFKVIEIGL